MGVGAGVLAAVGLAVALTGGLDVRLSAEPGAADDGIAVELPEAGTLTGDAPVDAGEFGDEGFRGEVVCLVPDCLAWQMDSEARQATQIATGNGAGGGVLLGTELTGARTVTGENGTEQAASGAVWAIDADTGQELWRREVPVADDGRPLWAMAAGEQVLVVDGDGILSSHDLRDGTLRWERPSEDAAPVLDAAVIDRVLVVVTGERFVPGEAELSVQALDPDTGDRRWMAGPVPAVILTSVGPVLFEPFDTMVGLDPHDGSERWREPHDHEALYGEGHGPLATVVAENELAVVDARDGQTLFRRSAPASGWAGGIPASDAQGVAVVQPDELSYLGVDGTSWTRPVPGCCLGTTIGTDTITIVGQGGEIRRFDRDDGTLLDELPGFDGPARVHGILGGYLISGETGDQESGSEPLMFRDLLTGQAVAQTSGRMVSLLVNDDRLLIDTGGRIYALRSPTERRG